MQQPSSRDDDRGMKHINAKGVVGHKFSEASLVGKFLPKEHQQPQRYRDAGKCLPPIEGRPLPMPAGIGSAIAVEGSSSHHDREPCGESRRQGRCQPRDAGCEGQFLKPSPSGRQDPGDEQQYILRKILQMHV